MTAMIRPPAWLVMPVVRDEDLGLAFCLRCQSNFHYRHQCPGPPPTRDELSVLKERYKGWGWMSCLHCRTIYRGGEHGCSPPPPPRPARAANPVLTGSFDDADAVTRIIVPGYGYRVGSGFWAMYGYTDDRSVRDRRRHGDYPYHSPANRASHETEEEAVYWRRWRRRNMFITKAHELSRTAFLLTASRGGMQPHVPGNSYPHSYHRYRVMGAAGWYGSEIVIDLAFWLGPPYQVTALDYACEDAEKAIIRHWPHDAPNVKAGFAWGEARL